MPKRSDIKKILVIGSGPIVIGSAAEFDYSGSQAALSLREEGYEVILVNPNPATYMTDQKIADKVYMEPLTPKFLKYIISNERPDALIPSMGGQTALNLAVELDRLGILKKYNVEVLGAPIDSIMGAEDREIFKNAMIELGVPTPPSKVVNNYEDALAFGQTIGLPLIIRPSYTMGGGGGGIASDWEEFEEIANRGMRMSPTSEILVEKSIAGFKEIEYEVMRDANDTAIVVCNMENIDPVGVHTGDSMVVAPSLTLTNKQYQMLRDASLKIIKHFKIEGGCNVQLALDPNTDNYYIIEINPRVSRSSALASKATGYPIAKISAKIAVGMHLDEIINPITKVTMASFEPSIDYIVSKLARFPFDKFRANSSELGTSMQATGETMSIGRTFEESFLKSIRSLDGEFKYTRAAGYEDKSVEELLKEISKPTAYRIWQIFELFRKSATVEQIFEVTKIDRYFLHQFKKIIDIELETVEKKGDIDALRKAKEMGMSDLFLSIVWNMSQKDIYALRTKHNVKPVYKMIDTIAGEFESKTNYLYSTYMGIDNESRITNNKKKVIIVGSGPIRIGQGVEFDYSTVHSILTYKALGYETIVINNNPETVSTDFSIADKLYFEPINGEEINEIWDMEKPEGVVLQFGGQTAINVAKDLESRGIKIIGTQNDSIDLAEDRERFEKVVKKLGILQPQSEASANMDEIPKIAEKIGYPVLIRPSYVIGGKGMQIVTNEEDLRRYLKMNVLDYKDNVILVDKYLPGKEVEIDAVSDGENVFIPGIMEHIEKSGIHSGDSTTIFPSISIGDKEKEQIVEYTKLLAKELKIIGLMNIQFILWESKVYVLEVNTRSSRTIPYISKATKTNVVEIAVKVLDGTTLAEQGFVGLNDESQYSRYFVKSPVFSFHKLHKVTDIALGPEMKSTGESIGIDENVNKAVYKSLLGSDFDPLKHSKVMMTVNDEDKKEALEIAKILNRVDVDVYSTKGTYEYLIKNGAQAKLIPNLDTNRKQALIDFLKENKISYLINTPGNLAKAAQDAQNIRTMSLLKGVPVITSIRLAKRIALLTEQMRFLVKPSY